jgi:glycosyltransferase involved in cell wall biosynthesis
MNIGIFTNAYHPIISGVVNAIALFRRGLAGLGHRVFVFAPAFPGFRDEEEDIYRFRSVNLTSKVKFPLALPYSHRIFRIIPGLKLDVIHTHHPFILGEVGAHFARKFKIPLVYTFHTQFEQYAHYIPFNQDLVKMLARLSVINYTQKCDCIITPAPSIRDLLLSYGVTQRLELLPNAIDLDSFGKGDGSAVRREYSIPADAVVLLYVGRMGLEKNLGFLLQSFHKILETGKKVRLLVVGEGPEEEAVREQARRMGLEGNAIFTGRIEYSGIPAFYDAADFFVMSSVTEVKPLALLEAMASGLPVVAVAASGSSDTITQGVDGILTELSLENFTAACLELVNDIDKRREMSRNARKTSARYSIGETSRRLAGVYEELTAERKSR